MDKRRHSLLFLFLSIILILTNVEALPASSSSLTATISGNINPKIIWEKAYGGIGDDRAFYITNSEGGYLVVGSSSSQMQNLTAAWALLLDYHGDVVWNQTYLEAAGSEFRYAMTLDDGFLLVGNVFVPSGDQDGYAMKITKDGTQLWKVTVGGPEVDKLFSATKTQDGDFILAGLTNSFNAINSDAWVVKVDGKGKVLWNKTYGGESEDAARSIMSSGHDSYVVGGYTNSMGNGDYDFLFLKIDGSGNMLWNRTYGGLGSDKAYAVAASNGDYIIAGDTQSRGAGNSDAWVIKVDSNGREEWQRALGGKDFDSAACITVSENGSILVGGFTLSFGNGMRDVWLSRIDSDGSVQWSFALGRKGYEEAYGVVEAEGNELLLAGWTDFTGQGRYDYYVVDVEVELKSVGDYVWPVYVAIGFGILFLAIFVFVRRRKERISLEFG